jgi:serine protease inhibitor
MHQLKQFENLSFSSPSVQAIISMFFVKAKMVRQFQVNCPFFFALVGHESKNVYFTGRMTDF